MSSSLIAQLIQFGSLLSGSLLAGALFGVYLCLNPAGLDAESYTRLQQRGVKTLNTPMPLLGIVTLMFTVAGAVMMRGNPVTRLLMAGAGLSFLIAGLVTRFVNQPINSRVMSWSPTAVPASWAYYRARWWHWHLLRTVAGITGLCLLIAAAVLRP
jgi:uncharacterized membrane protein